MCQMWLHEMCKQRYPDLNLACSMVVPFSSPSLKRCLTRWNWLVDFRKQAIFAHQHWNQYIISIVYCSLCIIKGQVLWHCIESGLSRKHVWGSGESVWDPKEGISVMEACWWLGPIMYSQFHPPHRWWYNRGEENDANHLGSLLE